MSGPVTKAVVAEVLEVDRRGHFYSALTTHVAGDAGVPGNTATLTPLRSTKGALHHVVTIVVSVKVLLVRWTVRFATSVRQSNYDVTLRWCVPRPFVMRPLANCGNIQRMAK